MRTRMISVGTLFFCICFFSITANGAELVTFEGKSIFEEALQLNGILHKPEGEGPFPAVVMLCGCGGLKNEVEIKQQNAWVKRLLSWGYVALQVDSFGPRGYDNICDKNVINDRMRSLDAFYANAYLSSLEFVDPNNLAVMGWSHGGWAVMKIADGSNREGGSEPFQAAVAIYPWCTKISKLDTPLLILIGEKDDWTLPGRCVNLETSVHAQGTECEFVLKIYPDAYHGYDIEGINEEYLGHHIEYNPEAANDTIAQTRDFLAKYLKAKR